MPSLPSCRVGLAKAGFRDAAMAGSSALTAAVWRSFLDESAAALSVTCGTAYIDIDKFYDSLDAVKLLGRLKDFAFPPLQLALHGQVHWACRLIMSNDCCDGVLLVVPAATAWPGGMCMTFVKRFTSPCRVL